MIQSWEEISRETVAGKYRRYLESVVFRMPDGVDREFYLKREGHTVCALALNLDNQVILTRQFRPGPGEILNELPGGGMDANESPEQAMTRELLEETGYQGKVKYVGFSYPCGYSNVKRHCVVITECQKVSEPKLDEGEFVETVLMSLDEFRKLLQSGRMTDIQSGYMCLDFLGLL